MATSSRVALTSLPVILQEVEFQLQTYQSAITADSVVGDVSNIYWVFKGDEPPPATTGQRDILFALHKDKLVNVEGDGRFAMMFSGFDVYLRSSYAVDPRSTRKQWFIDNRLRVDALMDALMGFFPTDQNGFALTIEGLVLDENASPEKERDSKTWGITVGTYVFHYQPNIDPFIIG